MAMTAPRDMMLPGGGGQAHAWGEGGRCAAGGAWCAHAPASAALLDSRLSQAHLISRLIRSTRLRWWSSCLRQAGARGRARACWLQRLAQRKNNAI